MRTILEGPREGDTIETIARGKYAAMADGRPGIVSDAGERLRIPDACEIRVVERAPVDDPAKDEPGTIREKRGKRYVLSAPGSALAGDGRWPWINLATGAGWTHHGMIGCPIVGVVPGSPADKPVAPEGVKVYVTVWNSANRWAVRGSEVWRLNTRLQPLTWHRSDLSSRAFGTGSTTEAAWDSAWPPLPGTGRVAVAHPPLTQPAPAPNPALDALHEALRTGRFANGYTVQQITQTAGALTVAEARRLARTGRKIPAIKLIREQVPGLGLREAKEFVEALVPPRKFERGTDIPADVRAVEDTDGYLAERTPSGGRWFYSRLGRHARRKPYSPAAHTFAVPSDDAPFVEVVE